MSNRTADEIRSGRVMSTQCMFHTALAARARPPARLLGGAGPADRGPRRLGRRPRLARHGPAQRAIDWLGRLDGYAQSVDQRVKMAGWMETFAQRGGQLVIHGAAVSDLDYFSRTYDLVLVVGRQGRAGLDVRPRRRPLARTASRSAPSPSPTSTASARARSTPTPTRSAATSSPAWASCSSCRRSPRPAAPTSCSGRAYPAARWTSSTASRTRRSTCRLTLELMERFTPVGVRAGHQGRADRRGRHAGRPLRAHRAQPGRPAARRRPGARRRRRRRRQRPDHRAGLQLGAKCAAAYLAVDPGARREGVRRGVDAADVRPVLGRPPSTSPSGRTPCWPRRRSTCST